VPVGAAIWAIRAGICVTDFYASGFNPLFRKEWQLGYSARIESELPEIGGKSGEMPSSSANQGAGRNTAEYLNNRRAKDRAAPDDADVGVSSTLRRD
jgi:hypothetical protein